MLDFLATVAVLYFAPRWWKNIHVKNGATALVVALAIGLCNIFFKPFFLFFSFPLTLLTFGLFVFVINAFIIWLVSGWFAGFKIKSFSDALLLAIVIGILQALLP